MNRARSRESGRYEVRRGETAGRNNNQQNESARATAGARGQAFGNSQRWRWPRRAPGASRMSPVPELAASAAATSGTSMGGKPSRGSRGDAVGTGTADTGFSSPANAIAAAAIRRV